MNQMVGKYNHHQKAVEADDKGDPEDWQSQVGKDLSTAVERKTMSEGLNRQTTEYDKGGETKDDIENHSANSIAFMVEKFDGNMPFCRGYIGEGTSHSNNTAGPHKIVSSCNANVEYPENDIYNRYRHHQHNRYPGNVGKDNDETAYEGEELHTYFSMSRISLRKDSPGRFFSLAAATYSS